MNKRKQYIKDQLDYDILVEYACDTCTEEYRCHKGKGIHLFDEFYLCLNERAYYVEKGTDKIVKKVPKDLAKYLPEIQYVFPDEEQFEEWRKELGE